jgi:hypothetical protein
MGLCLLGFSVGQEICADINAALGPSPPTSAESGWCLACVWLWTVELDSLEEVGAR